MNTNLNPIINSAEVNRSTVSQPSSSRPSAIPLNSPIPNPIMSSTSNSVAERTVINLTESQVNPLANVINNRNIAQKDSPHKPSKWESIQKDGDVILVNREEGEFLFGIKKSRDSQGQEMLYIGTFDVNYEFHGNGVLLIGDHTYIGLFKHGKREGQGSLSNPFGVYMGEWKSDQLIYGEKIALQYGQIFSKYRGYFKNQNNANTEHAGSLESYVAHGQGRCEIGLNSCEGIWIDGNLPIPNLGHNIIPVADRLEQKRIRWDLVQSETAVFIGRWEDDRLVYGIRKSKNSDEASYEGEFNSNLEYQGKGIIRNTSQLYVGDFKNGKKEGKGTLFTEKCIYVGEWTGDELRSSIRIPIRNSTTTVNEVKDSRGINSNSIDYRGNNNKNLNSIINNNNSDLNASFGQRRTQNPRKRKVNDPVLPQSKYVAILGGSISAAQEGRELQQLSNHVGSLGGPNLHLPKRSPSQVLPPLLNVQVENTNRVQEESGATKQSDSLAIVPQKDPLPKKKKVQFDLEKNTVIKIAKAEKFINSNNNVNNNNVNNNNVNTARNINIESVGDLVVTAAEGRAGNLPLPPFTLAPLVVLPLSPFALTPLVVLPLTPFTRLPSPYASTENTSSALEETKRIRKDQNIYEVKKIDGGYIGETTIVNEDGYLLNYKGEFNTNLEFHGQGELKYRGQIYTGKFQNGKRYGEGCLETEKYFYKGMWKEGQLLSGTRTERDRWTRKEMMHGSSYTGEFRNICEREFITLLSHGSGRMFYKSSYNKKTYYHEGDFQNDQRHGKGSLICGNCTWEGEWKNGVLSIGRMVIKNDDGTSQTYEGTFDNLRPTKAGGWL